MSLKLPERRSRRLKPQKQVEYRVENELHSETISQYFQIAVNILNGKKYVWANQETANSYVIVRLGKKRRRTAVRKNMEEPYYREYFVFEMLASIRDIQRLNLNLSVLELRRLGPARLLGEANIEMASIWNKPYHQIFRKWVQLSKPKDPSSGPVGFLKVDISIIFRGEIQYIPPIVKEEDIEENLLISSGFEQNRCNYMVTIYKAFCLPNSNSGDQKYGKYLNTFVKVTYCGLEGKTTVQRKTNNPEYNERLSFVEMFPNMCQIINIEIFSHEGIINKLLCSTQLKLDQISHEGDDGFLPTFGPSLIPMYGSSKSGHVETGPFYKGSLLLSFNVVVPYYQQGIRSINKEPIFPIPKDNLWKVEDFCIFCTIFEVTMIDNLISGKDCGVAISMGNIFQESNSKDFDRMLSEIDSKKLYYTGHMKINKTTRAYGHLDFPQAFPTLQTVLRLPDFRYRMYQNNVLRGIISDLGSALEDIEERIKAFKYKLISEIDDALKETYNQVVSSIHKYLNILQSNSFGTKSNKFTTDFDKKLVTFHMVEAQKIYRTIRAVLEAKNSGSKSNQNMNSLNEKLERKRVKVKIGEAREILEQLQSLIFNVSNGWPDLIIWLLSNGSRVGYKIVPAADIIYSSVQEQSGKLCGNIETVYLKPLKCPKHMDTLNSGCYCIAAKVELNLWMGLFREKSIFFNNFPKGYSIRTRDIEMCIIGQETMAQARCFIHRAKLNSGIDSSGLADTFVRMNAFNATNETRVKYHSLTPVYNEVLKIEKSILIPEERLMANPYIILIEVYNKQTCTRPEIIGRVRVQPSVDRSTEYEYAPKLQWYDLYRGFECTGQLLMSAQIIIVIAFLLFYINAGKLPKSDDKPATESSIFKSSKMINILKKTEIETLPINLLPKSTTYKLDVYWWGLRDIPSARKPCIVLDLDDVTIKSEIIPDNKSNSNFPNGRASQVFEAPLNDIFYPPLSVNLYDTSTFGRQLILGANVIKNPKKYMVNWLHQMDRKASLNSIFIPSRNSTAQLSEEEIMGINADLVEETEDYGSSFKVLSLFKNKKTSEEKYKLLPTKKGNQNTRQYGVKNKAQNLDKDWWLKFLCSQTGCTDLDEFNPIDRITIYNSELECQPEFSKFKDWCIGLKLYKGKKSGIPEKDEKLFCGIVKAGIAIYKWPPPGDTIAVSTSGVDLNKGFFNEHPSNDSSKYLVRVYIIKAFNLMAKDFMGKSDPYVILQCGKKTMGERKSYVANTLNPIFGRLYEFKATMPEDYILSISIYDYDMLPPDDIIGCTAIDLEDRIYTKHRATCGLSRVYNSSGTYKWRDCMKPSTILEELCQKNHIPVPSFASAKVEARETSSIEQKENSCLKMLRDWHSIPICGHYLVPEHVETRTLYHNKKPGLDQGKLQLWVDIFPLDTGYPIPPAIDITPSKIEEYELRVIVWDVDGIRLDDYDVLSGRRSSDIYVKIWIGHMEESQSTDIHYRSTNGVGNFNWRMVFNIFYQHAERKIVIKRNKLLKHNEELMLPVLLVHVMDSDFISADDFLGSLRLNLNAMPRGAGSPSRAKSMDVDKMKKVNLFSLQSQRGWWPLASLDPKTKKNEYAGAIDLELTLLPKEVAASSPVGLGREGPHALPPPKRPENVFNPLSNPLRYIKSIFTGRLKWISGFLCSIFIIIFLLSGYLALPRVLIERWLGRKRHVAIFLNLADDFKITNEDDDFFEGRGHSN